MGDKADSLAFCALLERAVATRGVGKLQDAEELIDAVLHRHMLAHRIAELALRTAERCNLVLQGVR